MNKSILFERDENVATITINREDRRNSLDHVAMKALASCLETCAEEDIRVAIITGAGGKSFCAGDDVKAYADRSKDESRAHFEHGLRTFDALERMPCLTIAAIDGFCLGGGLELALCCDLRVAGRGALFGLPEILKLNALPSWGGLTRLSKTVGQGAAKRISFMGEKIGAEEAFSMGLIARVVDDNDVLADTMTFAKAFADNVDRETIDVAKRVINDAGTLTPTTATLVNLLAERSQAFEGV
ncbi:MAG: enoyl-CoA hydratase/isomerase family protein [Thalassospira sp.]|uniref:enoyl-CoA hydratase/isomerase family protein n=1 Tax=Thalassospira sp. TaxID=1912094 RepID=UPI003A84DA58